jgi:hypothetical protein
MDNQEYFKQLLHIAKDKIIVVTKKCLNYNFVKMRGFILWLNYPIICEESDSKQSSDASDDETGRAPADNSKFTDEDFI